MSQPLETSIQQRGEFTRLDIGLIKIEAGSLGRGHEGDLEALKSSITWRERRQKGSGLLQPLIVSQMEGVPFYRLEDGLRRFRAVQELVKEGFPIDTVPVRILSAPLTLVERMMLLGEGGKPLEALEEAHLLKRLEAQGMTLEALASVIGRNPEELKSRRLLTELGPRFEKALEVGTLSPAALEKALEKMGIITTPTAEQLTQLEEAFAGSLKFVKSNTRSPLKKPLGDTLGAKSHNSTHPAWIPKVLDPTMHYLALSGLYEWMGGEGAARKGYSKKVVDIVTILLNYTGGKLTLTETAEKLRKH